MVRRLLAARASRIPDHDLNEIRERFLRSGDWTRYGLANAITSVARDTRDRRLRWDLEEFGRAVLAGDIGVPPDRNLTSGRAPSRAEASVEL